MTNNSPRRRYSPLLAGSILLLAATGVSASPIGTVNFDFDAGNLFPDGHDVVRVHFSDGTHSENATVRAGVFGATATDSDGAGGFDPTSLYRDENAVLLYCVDLLDNLLTGNPTVYNVYNVAQDEVEDKDYDGPRRDFARMLDFLGAVNFVMMDRGFTFGINNWLEPGSGWLAGAIQIGIWESLYETSGEVLNVSVGQFRVNGVDPQGSNSNAKLSYEGSGFLTDAFLAMDSASALDASLIKRFVPTDGQGNEVDGQELIGDPRDVPSPAPLTLLLTGLGLLSWRRRTARR